MNTKKSKSNPSKEKKATQPEAFSADWDLIEEMGILPKNRSLTQNVGCVGGKSQKK